MFRSSGLRRACLAVVLVVSLAGAALGAVVPMDSEQLLSHAENVKTSDHPEFLRLLKQLDSKEAGFSARQRMHLRYLRAWELGYQGNYEAATPQLNAILAESTDTTLRFRVGTTLVNMLAIGSHYEEAFERTSALLGELPQITDKNARIQALGVASMLYNDAGQYDLGLNYANRMLRENPDGDGDCKGRVFRAESLFQSGNFTMFEERAREAIEACTAVSEPLYANGIRLAVARRYIQQEQAPAAITLLRKYLAEVRRINYPELTAGFDAALARAYWKQGQVALARQFAEAAIADGVKQEFTKARSTAYESLYLIEKTQGNADAALAYHEEYMAADKGYLNALSTKALAYQTVKQQVLAKKLQVDTLAKQNKILQLQQALGKKAVEASRLWIILLVSLLGFIGFVAYLIKRSQLRFMKLARRDGLTGIFNRQHFVSEAERQLQYCRKSARDACLVLIDLDHFKVVNDTHGHAVGDRVLKRAVAACQAHLRSTDLFGRLGGEEFGMLLPECMPDQVMARVELMRAAVASVSLGDAVPGLTISASFGISSAANSGYELRQLMIDADEALYQAKRDGRNRISLSESRHVQMSLV